MVSSRLVTLLGLLLALVVITTGHPYASGNSTRSEIDAEEGGDDAEEGSGTDEAETTGTTRTTRKEQEKKRRDKIIRDNREKEFKKDVKSNLQDLCAQTNELLKLDSVRKSTDRRHRRKLGKMMVTLDSVTKNQAEFDKVIADIKVTQKATLGEIQTANQRNTRMSEQHVERARAAVGGTLTGIGQIKAGVEGDDPVAIMQGITSIVGGILAVIPNPYAKAAGILFDIIGGFLSIFGAKAAPTVEDYIKEMGNELTNKMYEIEFAKGQGDRAYLTYWYEYLNSHPAKHYNVQEWEAIKDRMPENAIGIRELGTLKDHIKTLMADARGVAAFKFIKLYVNTAQVLTQIYIKYLGIYCISKEIYKDEWEREHKARRRFQKQALEGMIEMLLMVTPTTIMTQQFFLPPKFSTESADLLKEINKITYQEEGVYDPDTNEEIGDIMEFPDMIELENGNYLLESDHSYMKGWSYYMHDTTDFSGNVPQSHWDMWIYQLPKGTTCGWKRVTRYISGGAAMGAAIPITENKFVCTNAVKYYKMGRKISLHTSTKNSVIKIATYEDGGEEESKFKTMTFKDNGGKVTFFVSGKDNHGKSAENTIDNVDIWSVSKDHPTDPAIDGMTTLDHYRIIPIKKDGNEIRVVIGHPNGNHFLYYDGSYHHCHQGLDAGCTRSFVYRTQMKQMACDPATKEVKKGYVWILHKQ